MSYGDKQEIELIPFRRCTAPEKAVSVPPKPIVAVWRVGWVMARRDDAAAPRITGNLDS